jgi:hypothetical protein
LDLVAARQNAAAALVERVIVFLGLFGFGFSFSEFRFDRFLIGVRDRVIVGVDFREGERKPWQLPPYSQGSLRDGSTRVTLANRCASELFSAG